MAASTMRLLAILELLQSRQEMTGTEIAERLNVDPRSVRRYIKALQDMGVPIEGERGRYGAYRLDRGFKLPPMMFTEDEAVALTLGLMVIRAFQFPIDLISVAGALAKIERVMPEALLNRTMALQETIHFNYVMPPTYVRSTVVRTLTTAMQHGQRLKVQYLSWKDKSTDRMFDPYGIVFHEGWWYVAGYCHLRQDLRTFRIDRIQLVEQAEGSFVRPVDFDAVAHVSKSLSDPTGIASVEVLFMTSLDEAKRSIPAELGSLEMVDKGVMFRRPAYRLEWVAPILLSVDFPIRIIQPPELKTMIQELGKKAMKMVDTANGQNRGMPTQAANTRSDCA
ncbi:MAG: YafY family transcriptional regulator [Chloroflexales bacterium]|nr:YafY family transcriptional regulator [Chloroflexales bacterium]